MIIGGRKANKPSDGHVLPLLFFDGTLTKAPLLLQAALQRSEATSLGILTNITAKGCFSLLDRTMPLSFVSVCVAPSSEEPQSGLAGEGLSETSLLSSGRTAITCPKHLGKLRHPQALLPWLLVCSCVLLCPARFLLWLQRCAVPQRAAGPSAGTRLMDFVPRL